MNPAWLVAGIALAALGVSLSALIATRSGTTRAVEAARQAALEKLAERVEELAQVRNELTYWKGQTMSERAINRTLNGIIRRGE